MKKIEFDGKKILVITINGEPLLEIHESQKKEFYRLLIALSKKYKLILVTDMPQCKSFNLLNEIGIKDGFIINNCGSSIFDIKNKEIIMIANIKKQKMLPIFRQALVGGDSVLIHSYKKIYVYTHYLKLIKYTKDSFNNVPVELIENYDLGIKNLMRNKIESLEIINTFYDASTINSRNEKIHSICENEDLIYNQVSSSRLLIIDSSINNAVDFIMKEINMQFTEVFLINLTNIFHNQNISSSIEYNIENTMEALFEYRIFSIFDKEFKDILINNFFLFEDELE